MGSSVPGVQRRGLTSAIFAPLLIDYSWAFLRLVCSMTCVSSTLEMRNLCGASSPVRGCPGAAAVRAASPLVWEARGCCPHAMINGATHALVALMQKITPNLPICLLGSLFLRARANTCRNMLLCLFHASASFLSSKIQNEVATMCLTRQQQQECILVHTIFEAGFFRYACFTHVQGKESHEKKNQSPVKQITAF